MQNNILGEVLSQTSRTYLRWLWISVRSIRIIAAFWGLGYFAVGRIVNRYLSKHYLASIVPW